jgi:hypothetical protein
MTTKKREVYDLLIKELARAANRDLGELFRLMEMSRFRTLQGTTKPLSLAEVRARLPVGTTPASSPCAPFHQACC